MPDMIRERSNGVYGLRLRNLLQKTIVCHGLRVQLERLKLQTLAQRLCLPNLGQPPMLPLHTERLEAGKPAHDLIQTPRKMALSENERPQPEMVDPRHRHEFRRVVHVPLRVGEREHFEPLQFPHDVREHVQVVLVLVRATDAHRVSDAVHVHRDVQFPHQTAHLGRRAQRPCERVPQVRRPGLLDADFAEEVRARAVVPRLAYAGEVRERALVGAEVVDDLVEDLGGYGHRAELDRGRRRRHFVQSAKVE